jgi:hypothetical protein
MSLIEHPSQGTDATRNRTNVARLPPTASVELEVVFHRYRNGAPVSTLARDLQTSFDWVAQQVMAHGVRREVPVKRTRRGLLRAELDDPRWILQQLDSGADVRAISELLGIGVPTVRNAMKRFGITPPPSSAFLKNDAARHTDPVRRYQVAVERARKARLSLERAYALQVSAVIELSSDGLIIPAIADRLETDVALVEALLDHRLDSPTPACGSVQVATSRPSMAGQRPGDGGVS